jgi:hypothetical protein
MNQVKLYAGYGMQSLHETILPASATLAELATMMVAKATNPLP